ncbi:unnamed protein product [Peniophora sp. CBMAI 1063]|nr:unnamed protein product [Peniophora sp. CBMAI 1063]
MASAPISSLLGLLKHSLGSEFIGCIVCSILQGSLFYGAFIYIRFYRDDPLYLKLWVAAVLTVQTICTALIIHTTFYLLVTNYFNPAFVVEGAPLSSKLVAIFGPISNLLVQSFFARRAFIIGRKYWPVTAFAMLMNVASCGFFIGTAASAFAVGNLQKSLYSGSWIVTTGSALSLAGDLQLSAILIWALHKNRTGFNKTNTMIDALIAYTISSGLLICVLNLIAVILLGVFPHSIYYLTTLWVGTLVNSNSFMVSLNSRKLIQNIGDPDLSTTIPTSNANRNFQRQQIVTPIRFTSGPTRSQTTQDNTDVEMKSVRTGLHQPVLGDSSSEFKPTRRDLVREDSDGEHEADASILNISQLP